MSANYPPPPAPGSASGRPEGAGRPGRNPLGLASLVAGALISLLGLLFIVVQAAVIGSGSPEALGALSAVAGVLTALLGIAAIVLGVVAILRPGLSKTFAAAGIALGAAGLVSVFGTILSTVLIQVFYSF